MGESYIPFKLRAFIQSTIGHNDYALFVLDGQTAHDDGDWHDAVAIVHEAHKSARVIQFFVEPQGAMTYREVA